MYPTPRYASCARRPHHDGFNRPLTGYSLPADRQLRYVYTREIRDKAGIGRIGILQGSGAVIWYMGKRPIVCQPGSGGCELGKCR